MNLKEVLRIGSSALALVLGVLAPLTRAGAQNAGSVGAVNPSATGTPPGGGARTLAIGNAVVRNERLQTSATGSLHVTLSDRTTLNLGPSTNLVIDQYVYNPSTGAGSLQANLRSGLLRFVGGQTSHDGNATVQTPVATIGIRGNMFMARYDPVLPGLIVTNLGPGSLTISNRVSTQVIERAGYSVTVTSADAVILAPVRADPGRILADFAPTISRPGQNGGTPRRPPDVPALNLPPLPSIAGSALDQMAIQSIQQSIGRSSAQGRLPRRVLPRTPVATPDNQGSNPYGDIR